MIAVPANAHTSHGGGPVVHIPPGYKTVETPASPPIARDTVVKVQG